MLLHWLRRLPNSAPPAPNPPPPPRPRRPRSVPLGLEALEARAVPSTTLTWTGQGGDDLWSDADNWKHTGGPDKVPAVGDNLVFPAGVSNLNSRNDISGSAISLSGGI